MHEENTFTVEAASRTLPLISRIVQDVMGKHLELQELRDQYQRAVSEEFELVDPEETDDLHQLDEHQMVLMLQIHAFEKEINEVGGILRDAASGEIDFPCVLDGKRVHLCWLPGDEKITYWHEVDGDYTVREPLPVLV